MEKMNVLIVDDQINVVSGVMFGVHWDRLGISQIYKAYNAYEAKQVLLEKQVDIMLCDIEMPVENGLSLLAWCRKQEMDVETIFLTAHADFLYAKEAVALGSFDYILQPARYEEIEDAVGRATEKIRMKQRVNEDSRYGQLLKNKKGVVLGAMLADLFSEEKNDVEIAMRNLEEIGICVTENSRLSLLDVVRWGKGLENWDQTLLYDTISNVLEELFYPYAWKALLCQQEKGIYYVLLCTDSAAELNEESMYHQMERFQITFQKFFDCGVAIYYGALEDRQAVWELVRILKKPTRTMLDAKKESTMCRRASRRNGKQRNTTARTGYNF